MRELPGGLPVARFLDRHWQKTPLLARGAVDAAALSIDPATVRDLATRADAPSRLVRLPEGAASWTGRSGPFTAAELNALPPRGWSLLVHEADRHLPALAALRDRFRFAPNWRLDDVMVSLAPDGAGVGPHVDRYDVFLIQARGRRRWRVGAAPLEGSERLLRGAGIRVLEEPEFAEEHAVEPGDLLYLPPRFAHEGVAVGESVTCSVGFRTPDPRALLSDYLVELPPPAFEAIRYADPDLTPVSDPGEIGDDHRRRLRESARRLFEAGGAFDLHVGRHLTRPLREPPELAPPTVASADALAAALRDGATLRRRAPANFAWFSTGAGTNLFVGGEAYPLPREAEAAARTLCGPDPLDHSALSPHLADAGIAMVVIDALIRGFLVLES